MSKNYRESTLTRIIHLAYICWHCILVTQNTAFFIRCPTCLADASQTTQATRADIKEIELRFTHTQTHTHTHEHVR